MGDPMEWVGIESLRVYSWLASLFPSLSISLFLYLTVALSHTLLREVKDYLSIIDLGLRVSIGVQPTVLG